MTGYDRREDPLLFMLGFDAFVLGALSFVMSAWPYVETALLAQEMFPAGPD